MNIYMDALGQGKLVHFVFTDSMVLMENTKRNHLKTEKQYSNRIIEYFSSQCCASTFFLIIFCPRFYASFWCKYQLHQYHRQHLKPKVKMVLVSQAYRCLFLSPLLFGLTQLQSLRKSNYPLSFLCHYHKCRQSQVDFHLCWRHKSSISILYRPAAITVLQLKYLNTQWINEIHIHKDQTIRCVYADEAFENK